MSTRLVSVWVGSSVRLFDVKNGVKASGEVPSRDLRESQGTAAVVRCRESGPLCWGKGCRALRDSLPDCRPAESK